MHVKYKSRTLEKTLTDPKRMCKAYGVRAKKVNQRMLEIKASSTLEVLMTIPAANCHELSDGLFVVDVSANFRMVLEPTHNPVPRKADGGVDYGAVTEIKIIEIKDYH
jgi:hypothetical protein